MNACTLGNFQQRSSVCHGRESQTEWAGSWALAKNHNVVATTTPESCASPNNDQATKGSFACLRSTANRRLLVGPHSRREYQCANPLSLRLESKEPLVEFSPVGSKPTVAAFGPLGREIITGHESGKVGLFDAETGEELESNEKAHMGPVTDLQLSPDGTYFVTSSKDKTARIHDSKNLQVIKTFTTETPLNSACITPVKPYVIVGGGQDARSVTTTSTRSGKFETRFWHRVFEEEVGRVRGHFGPINTIAVHPSGQAFASGGEDGYVRVHWVSSSERAKRVGGCSEILNVLSFVGSLTTTTSAQGRTATWSQRTKQKETCLYH